MSESLVDQQRLLTAYWVRLSQLTKPEWTDFYRRVRLALLRCPAGELSRLPDSKESYIDEFFTEKIFYKAQRAAPEGIQSISGGALCGFFRNYLRDKLDTYKRFSDEDPELSEDPGTDDDDRHVREFLDETGEQELTVAVTRFIVELPDWGVLMLSGHFCAEEGTASPMSLLCKDIPSYHYKAQKLGVTVGKRPASLRGYETTLIGKWIHSLNVEIAPENRSVILFLLGALCLEAAAIVQEGSA